MGLLLLLIGVLAAGDGALAVWRAARSGRPAAAAVLLELFVGVSAIVGAGIGLARVRPLAWGVVLLLVGIVAVSLAVRLRQGLRERVRREASEGERLKRYVES